MLTFLLLLFFAGTAQDAQKDDMKDCPLHEQHMKAAAKQKEAKADASSSHHNTVNAHGEDARGMGFSQSDSVHRFHQTADGAIIEVRSKSATDKKLISQIREHMKYIATSFNNGDFSTPLFVHGTEPAGIARMKALSSEISYKYAELPNGAQVVITSNSADGVKALHDFMDFQSVEHHSELVQAKK
jgi:hypothetical protein